MNIIINWLAMGGQIGYRYVVQVTGSVSGNLYIFAYKYIAMDLLISLPNILT